MTEIFFGFVAIAFALAGAAMMKWKPVKKGGKVNTLKNALEAVEGVKSFDYLINKLDQPGAEKYLYNQNSLSNLYSGFKNGLKKISPKVDDLLRLKYNIDQALDHLKENSILYNKMSEVMGLYFEAPEKIGQALKHYIKSISAKRKGEKITSQT